VPDDTPGYLKRAWRPDDFDTNCARQPAGEQPQWSDRCWRWQRPSRGRFCQHRCEFSTCRIRRLTSRGSPGSRRAGDVSPLIAIPGITTLIFMHGCLRDPRSIWTAGDDDDWTRQHTDEHHFQNTHQVVPVERTHWGRSFLPERTSQPRCDQISFHFKIMSPEITAPLFVVPRNIPLTGLLEQMPRSEDRRASAWRALIASRQLRSTPKTTPRHSYAFAKSKPYWLSGIWRQPLDSGVRI